MNSDAEAQAVENVLHAYCRLVDDRDGEGLALKVYAADAVDDRRRGAPLRGHREIVAMFRRAWTVLDATAHLLSNVEVEVSGEVAHASSRVTAHHWLSESARLGRARPADFVILGTYEDELRRFPEGWRISHRVVGALGPGGVAAGTLPEEFRGFGGVRG